MMGEAGYVVKATASKQAGAAVHFQRKEAAVTPVKRKHDAEKEADGLSKRQK